MINNNSEEDGNAGGRTGDASNLFQGIVKCGLCGATMWHQNKGSGSGGGNKLVCRNRIQKNTGKQCEAKIVSYDEFEKLFFDRITRLDISDIIPSTDEIDNELSEVRLKLSESQGLVGKYKKWIKNKKLAINFAESEAIIKEFTKNVEDLQKEIKLQYKVIDILTKKVDKLENEDKELRNNLDQATEIYELLDSAKTKEERINIRIRLQFKIRQLLIRIRIFPLQEKYVPSQATDEPGVEKIMKSEYLNRVYLDFNVSNIEKPTIADRHGIIMLQFLKDHTDKAMEMTDEEIEKAMERGRKSNQSVARRLAKRWTKRS